MPATRADLLARLDALGIATTTVEHEPVFTVAESEALHARISGAHTKNLFLRDKKGQAVLLTAEAHTAVALKSLHEALGVGRLSFGSPDRLREHLGVEPGSVTPFAILNDTQGRVRMVLDARLREAGTINVHPLTNTATTSIARDDLLRFIEDTGHEVTWLDLPD